MSAQTVESVVCPHCNAQSAVTVRQIINAHNLVVKSAFLQGRMTATQCPHCGAIIVAAIPTLYYDASKELAFVFAPSDLLGSHPAQESIIGALIESLVDSMPTEQRTAYLLDPQRFSSLDRMIEAILAADGITGEVLQAQAAKAKLIEALLQSPSEAALKEKATAHQAELDYEFFELLTAYMQAAQMKGDQAGAQTFLALRALLGQWAVQSRKIIAEIDAKLGLVVIQSREELLEKLQSAKDSERAALVATGHVLLDQAFFQLLNAARDQAASTGDMATAKSLTDLSATVSKLKAAHAANSQAAMQRAAALFKAVVQSDTPDQVLERNVQDIDEAFFIVLGANIERARRQEQTEPARALELIGQLARTMLQEREVGG
jgi:hypothetical protein